MGQGELGSSVCFSLIVNCPKFKTRPLALIFMLCINHPQAREHRIKPSQLAAHVSGQKSSKNAHCRVFFAFGNISIFPSKEASWPGNHDQDVFTCVKCAKVLHCTVDSLCINFTMDRHHVVRLMRALFGMYIES
jgi:hypothetical protein